MIGCVGDPDSILCIHSNSLRAIELSVSSATCAIPDQRGELQGRQVEGCHTVVVCVCMQATPAAKVCSAVQPLVEQSQHTTKKHDSASVHLTRLHGMRKATCPV